MPPSDRKPTPAFFFEERDSRAIGIYGERVAARSLKRSGLKILLRNLKIEKNEIDLVCRDGDTLAFVEVKARRDVLHGQPSEAVDRMKRARLVRAAQLYLRELHRGKNRSAVILYRFDIVEVLLSPAQPPEIRHIRDAFGTDPNREYRA
ncbi:putative endonuclease [Verrucomicrobium sp. GAS474]|nr:putative endonuclease [Verrucomicrobium sp. GAS474]